MLGRARMRSEITVSSDEMEHCEGGFDDMVGRVCEVFSGPGRCGRDDEYVGFTYILI